MYQLYVISFFIYSLYRDVGIRHRKAEIVLSVYNAVIFGAVGLTVTVCFSGSILYLQPLTGIAGVGDNSR